MLYPLITWGGHEPLMPRIHQLMLRGMAPMLKSQMRKAMKLDGPDAVRLRDKRKQAILDMCDQVDAALKQSGGPFIFGEGMTYVDITFASLLYPMLRGFLTEDTKWANGRFSSFADYPSRHSATPISQFKVCQEFADDVAGRPCGSLIDLVYERRGGRL